MADDSARVHAVHNGYCATKPLPGSFLTESCADCGHSAVLHVGVDHCPVCEAVDLNQQSRRFLDPREREREALRLGIHGPLPWRSTGRTGG